MSVAKEVLLPNDAIDPLIAYVRAASKNKQRVARRNDAHTVASSTASDGNVVDIVHTRVVNRLRHAATGLHTKNKSSHINLSGNVSKLPAGCYSIGD